MLDCVHALEAPGVPVKFTYQSPGGTLTFSADSYAMDVRHGRLFVTAPQLRDPNGLLIAQMDNLTATGLYLPPRRRSDPFVRGHNFKGTLVRQSNGKFAFEGFLPTAKGNPSATPYNIQIDHCDVNVMRPRKSTPWTSNVKAGRLNVVGKGADWVATTRAQIADAGVVDTTIQNEAGIGVKVTGDTPSIQAAGLLRHILDTPLAERFGDLRKASVASLEVKGPFQVFVPMGKDPAVQASVDAVVSNVRYDKYAVEVGASQRHALDQWGFSRQSRCHGGGVSRKLRQLSCLAAPNVIDRKD